MRSERIRGFLTSGGLILLSGMAGISGYAFNLIISRLWDSSAMGRIIGVLGAANFFALPAALLVLPVAKWASQTPNWRRRLLFWQVSMFGIGLVFALLLFSLKGLWLRGFDIPHSWIMPLLLWMVPVFAMFFQNGVFLGRRAYMIMGLTGAVPQLGKPLLLCGAFLMQAFFHDPLSAIWVVAISQWVGALIGLIGLASLPNGEVVPDSSPSLWASGWVSVSSNAWITWDTAVAYMVLPTSGIAVYGVVSTLGKTPFYLASQLANMGINEATWGRSKKWATYLWIGGVGACCLLGMVVVGPLFMKLFGISRGLDAMLIYMVGNTILALSYYEMGKGAQQARHIWPPTLIALLLWTVWALLLRPGLLTLVSGMVAFLGLAALVTIWQAKRRDKLHLPRSKGDLGSVEIC